MFGDNNTKGIDRVPLDGSKYVKARVPLSEYTNGERQDVEFTTVIPTTAAEFLQWEVPLHDDGSLCEAACGECGEIPGNGRTVVAITVGARVVHGSWLWLGWPHSLIGVRLD